MRNGQITEMYQKLHEIDKKLDHFLLVQQHQGIRLRSVEDKYQKVFYTIMGAALIFASMMGPQAFKYLKFLF